jgi:hypothetical protein
MPDARNSSEMGPPLSTPQDPSYAYVSPETGVSYTAQELNEWGRGKINEHGDKVYFKPGFVIDDPWFRLRKSGELKPTAAGPS